MDARQLAAFQRTLEHQGELLGLERRRDHLVNRGFVDRLDHLLAAGPLQRQHPHGVGMLDPHLLQDIDAACVDQLLLAHHHIGRGHEHQLFDIAGALRGMHGVLLGQMTLQRAVCQRIATDEEYSELRGRGHDNVLCCVKRTLPPTQCVPQCGAALTRGQPF